MATILYRRDDYGNILEERVAGENVAFKLAHGWKCTPEELEIPSFEEADKNDTGKLSNKKVREAAKEAGIEDWETARIKRLKQDLGYESED